MHSYMSLLVLVLATFAVSPVRGLEPLYVTFNFGCRVKAFLMLLLAGKLRVQATLN
jgi:hypothetical protein